MLTDQIVNGQIWNWSLQFAHSQFGLCRMIIVCKSKSQKGKQSTNKNENSKKEKSKIV